MLPAIQLKSRAIVVCTTHANTHVMIRGCGWLSKKMKLEYSSHTTARNREGKMYFICTAVSP